MKLHLQQGMKYKKITDNHVTRGKIGSKSQLIRIKIWDFADIMRDSDNFLCWWGYLKSYFGPVKEFTLSTVNEIS